MRYAFVSVALVVAIAMTHGVSSAQPECTEVYLRVYDPVGDPPCGSLSQPQSDWSIRVTSSPTSVSGGTCSTFSLNQLYSDVDFYSNTSACGDTYEFTCDIIASASILSGYYYLADLGGGCFRVCETCTP